MNLIKNKSLFLSYVILLILAVGFYFVSRMPLSSLSLIFGFFLLIIFPGFSLSRIFNFDGKSNLDKIASWLALGFILIFTIILLAILLGLSMNLLISIGLTVFVLVFLAGLVLDLLRKEIFFHYDSSKIKDFLNFNSVLGLVLLALIIFTIIVLDGLGGLFKGGDPSFHLAIVKKAFEGISLSATNLSLVKANIHITYGYPVWHVFLGAITRIFHSDIFVVWKTIVVPISLMAIFIWYWLARKIMPTKSLAIFTIILFLIYILNKNTAFLFTCISIPDTLNNLIFMPLSIGLVLNYVLDQSAISLKKDWFILMTIALVNIFMAVIHLTQFFYLLMIVFMVGLFYLLFFTREKETKLILIKSALVLAANFIILLPLVAALFIKSNAIETLSGLFKNNPTEVFPPLTYHSFSKINTLAKYAYILLPLLLLFVRKNRQLVFTIALFAIVPIFYFEPIKFILMKSLGYIFVNRMYGSLVWHFVIWAFVFGVAFILIDRLMIWLSFSKKYFRWIVNIVALVGLGVFLWAEKRYGFINPLYSDIYNPGLDQWMNNYYWVVIIILSIIGLVVFYFQKNDKVANYFKLTEAQTLWLPVLAVCFTLVMLNFNKSDFFKWFSESQRHNYIFSAATYDSKPTYLAAGGNDLVNFINQNIPRKSVILVPGNIIFSLPIVTDQYMAGYPRSSALDRVLILYSSKFSDDDKLTNLKKSSIDYILVGKPSSQGIDFFNRHPELFIKIYENGPILFKVFK